ncbi:uncharacterized protein B0T15DRAFT_501936 [Chaetomium strumarium]|uniref:Uncharacterized protein n=1 Tax=Chaetomium strumarium TaxID=1170767 RepID=A0AAJ0M3C3_9PEZI|nr:hypothetical protein B0T15DRAFT_501936 [Chaetomium strumarium]
MHQRLEQCWELKRAGKAIYDFDAAYQASKEPAVSPTKQRFPRSYLEIPPPGRPPVHPERLKRAVEQSRADEARRRNEPHVRRLKELKERLARSSGQMAAWQAGGLPSGTGNHWLRNRPSGSNSSGTNRSGNRPSNTSKRPSSHSDSPRAHRWGPYRNHFRRSRNQTPRSPNRGEGSEAQRSPDRSEDRLRRCNGGIPRIEDVQSPPELKREPDNAGQGSDASPKLQLATPANSPTSTEAPAIVTAQQPWDRPQEQQVAEGTIEGGRGEQVQDQVQAHAREEALHDLLRETRDVFNERTSTCLDSIQGLSASIEKIQERQKRIKRAWKEERKVLVEKIDKQHKLLERILRSSVMQSIETDEAIRRARQTIDRDWQYAFGSVGVDSDDSADETCTPSMSMGLHHEYEEGEDIGMEEEEEEEEEQQPEAEGPPPENDEQVASQPTPAASTPPSRKRKAGGQRTTPGAAKRPPWVVKETPVANPYLGVILEDLARQQQRQLQYARELARRHRVLSGSGTAEDPLILDS